MERELIELASAFFGPLGLGILFHLRGGLLLPAALGGLLNRIVFLAVSETVGEKILPCL